MSADMKKRSFETFGSVRGELKVLRSKLEEAKLKEISSGSSLEVRAIEKRLHELYEREEIMYRQCRWISCRKNTGYHATNPKIRTQGAEHGRSWIATEHGDRSLETSNAQRTAERDTELYPGSGPSW
jgi:hypothetical protein